ncbi:hypothetical protein K9N68_04940 [Kovacikia minuta CCNUW1]|nr:hypothetical protein K9N68_04940 [Kovacikia minuta CCNUW1]
MEPQAAQAVSPVYVKACLLMLQAVYIDVEDLLGGRQAGLFQKDISEVFKQWRFPQTESPDAIKYLLTVDPLNAAQIPPWQEHHLNTLLQELHRIGKSYFGNTTFVERAVDTLQDLSGSDRSQFQTWLNQSPLGKLWR